MGYSLAAVLALAALVLYLWRRCRRLARDAEAWVDRAEREQREHFATLADAYLRREGRGAKGRN